MHIEHVHHHISCCWKSFLLILSSSISFIILLQTCLQKVHIMHLAHFVHVKICDVILKTKSQSINLMFMFDIGFNSLLWLTMIYRVPVQVDEISQVKALNFAKIIICVQNHLKHVQIFEKILPLIMSSILKKYQWNSNELLFDIYIVSHWTQYRRGILLKKI